MQEIDIKRGHFKNIDSGELKNMMKKSFEKVTEKDGTLISRYKALDPISVSIKDKKTLIVDIQTKQDVSDEDAMESIRAKNNFLLAATGFSTKERSKRLKNKAKKGTL